MEIPEDFEEIEKVNKYVADIQEVIGRIGIIPRAKELYPFDMVALELVNKSFALTRAVLTLLNADFGDEACGLCRSLVECSLTLRYLTKDPATLFQMTDKYIQYIKADKAYWMFQMLETKPDPEMEKKVYERAKMFGIVPDSKGASKHWSGEKGFARAAFLLVHPLDRSTDTESQKKRTYAVEYKHTSAFVHCAQQALDNYFPEEGQEFIVTRSTERYFKPTQFTLWVLVSHLHAVICYALFGMNVDRPDTVNSLFSETFNSLKKVKRLHS